MKKSRPKISLSPNSQTGRYEIRSLLGMGGMGEVYLAYDPNLRRQVAIKLLPAQYTENKVRLQRFEREAFAASSLNHPNIMTIHEIGQQDGSHFIAAEYIEGELHIMSALFFTLDRRWTRWPTRISNRLGLSFTTENERRAKRK